MRVGGWFRIGIVLALLHGALVATIALESRPRLEYKQSAWFSEAADVIAEILTKVENKEVRSQQVIDALLKGTEAENAAWLEGVASSPSENQKKFSTQVAKVNETHRAIISALPSEQRTHWLIALAWWLGGVLLLFSTGWVIGWVLRGFRAPAA